MNLSNLSRLETAIETHNVAGAAAAVFYDGAFETASAGLANVFSGVEMTDETVMHIGSITKVFNTTLVMQLVDEGLVELDKPVVEYVPEFHVKDEAATQAITVKMLLNHTSGIDGELLPAQSHDEEIIEKAIPRFYDMVQIHAPGQDCSYCNTAVVVAGYMVQKLTGKSWYDLVKEKIFIPLGMEHAVALPEDALLHRASVGHHMNPETKELVRTSFAFLSPSFAPAGSTLMMSAQDLVTFGRAHLAGGVGANGVRILTEKSAQAMQITTTRYKGHSFTDGFGLGWMVNDNGMIMHGGGGPGILSWLCVYPDRNFVAAMLTNTEHGGVVINDVLSPWLEEVVGVKTFLPAPPVPLKGEDAPQIDPRVYVGKYGNISMSYEITPGDDGGISVAIQFAFAVYDNTDTQKTPAFPLQSAGHDSFILDLSGESDTGNPLAARGPMAFKFVNPDENGQMQHIAIAGRLYRRIKKTSV